MANVSIAKLALIVWFDVTFVNGWLVTAPTEAPSTSTSATWYPVEGVMAKLWLPL